MLFKHKQVAHVPFQAEIGAAQSWVGVVGFARFGVLRAFVEEVFVPFELCFQAAFKIGSAAAFQAAVLTVGQ